MIELHIDSRRLAEHLGRMARDGHNLRPLMVGIREEMRSLTEENFEAEGNPRWKDLSQVSKDKREEDGHWPGKMLQVSGSLARGLILDSDAHMAMVGVGADVKHAAIQQLGGKAGRGQKVDIPARPYLPMDENKRLQPDAENSILDLAMTYLRAIALRN